MQLLLGSKPRLSPSGPFLMLPWQQWLPLQLSTSQQLRAPIGHWHEQIGSATFARYLAGPEVELDLVDVELELV